LALPGLFEEAGDLVDNFIVWRGRLLHRLPLIELQVTLPRHFYHLIFKSRWSLSSSSLLVVRNAKSSAKDFTGSDVETHAILLP
jgi:hypothetical protein